MNRDDAICAADLEPGEYEPTDSCVDCGADICIGYLRCTTCEAQHEAVNDPREAPTGRDVPRR